MDLSKLKEDLVTYLEKNNYSLWDLKFEREGDDYFLRIFIDNDNYDISLEELSVVNEYVSTIIDKYDSDLPPYYLEVSSPGAERDIRNENELEKAVDSYIHVEVNNDIYEGYLLDFTDKVLTLKVNFKGRIKNLKFNYEDLKYVRYAVKI